MLRLLRRLRLLLARTQGKCRKMEGRLLLKSRVVKNPGRDGGSVVGIGSSGKPTYESDNDKRKPGLGISVGPKGSKTVTHRGMESKAPGAGLHLNRSVGSEDEESVEKGMGAAVAGAWAPTKSGHGWTNKVTGDWLSNEDYMKMLQRGGKPAAKEDSAKVGAQKFGAGYSQGEAVGSQLAAAGPGAQFLGGIHEAGKKVIGGAVKTANEIGAEKATEGKASVVAPSISADTDGDVEEDEGDPVVAPPATEGAEKEPDTPSGTPGEFSPSGIDPRGSREARHAAWVEKLKKEGVDDDVIYRMVPNILDAEDIVSGKKEGKDVSAEGAEEGKDTEEGAGKEETGERAKETGAPKERGIPAEASMKQEEDDEDVVRLEDVHGEPVSIEDLESDKGAKKPSKKEKEDSKAAKEKADAEKRAKWKKEDEEFAAKQQAAAEKERAEREAAAKKKKDSTENARGIKFGEEPSESEKQAARESGPRSKTGRSGALFSEEKTVGWDNEYRTKKRGSRGNFPLSYGGSVSDHIDEMKNHKASFQADEPESGDAPTVNSISGRIEDYEKKSNAELDSGIEHHRRLIEEGKAHPHHYDQYAMAMEARYGDSADAEHSKWVNSEKTEQASKDEKSEKPAVVEDKKEEAKKPEKKGEGTETLSGEVEKLERPDKKPTAKAELEGKDPGKEAVEAALKKQRGPVSSPSSEVEKWKKEDKVAKESEVENLNKPKEAEASKKEEAPKETKKKEAAAKVGEAVKEDKKRAELTNLTKRTLGTLGISDWKTSTKDGKLSVSSPGGSHTISDAGGDGDDKWKVSGKDGKEISSHGSFKQAVDSAKKEHAKVAGRVEHGGSVSDHVGSLSRDLSSKEYDTLKKEVGETSEDRQKLIGGYARDLAAGKDVHTSAHDSYAMAMHKEFGTTDADKMHSDLMKVVEQKKGARQADIKKEARQADTKKEVAEKEKVASGPVEHKITGVSGDDLEDVLREHVAASGSLGEAIEDFEGTPDSELHLPGGGRAHSQALADKLKEWRPKEYHDKSDMVTVHHSTDRKTADRMMKEGVVPQLKPWTLASQRYAEGKDTEFSPGSGAERGLYVGKPGTTEGFGRATLEFQVPRKHVEVPVEAKNLGVEAVEDTLGTEHGGLIRKPIPASAIREVKASDKFSSKEKGSVVSGEAQARQKEAVKKVKEAVKKEKASEVKLHGRHRNVLDKHGMSDWKPSKGDGGRISVASPDGKTIIRDSGGPGPARWQVLGEGGNQEISEHSSFKAAAGSIGGKKTDQRASSKKEKVLVGGSRGTPPEYVVVGRKKSRNTADASDLAADYKARGIERNASYSQFVKDRNLNPGMNASEFYKVFDRATPARFEESTGGDRVKFSPTHWDNLTESYVQITPDATGRREMLWETGNHGADVASMPFDTSRYEEIGDSKKSPTGVKEEKASTPTKEKKSSSVAKPSVKDGGKVKESAKNADDDLRNRSIERAKELVREGHTPGSAVDKVRKEIVGEHGYPASYGDVIEHAREAASPEFKKKHKELTEKRRKSTSKKVGAVKEAAKGRVEDGGSVSSHIDHLKNNLTSNEFKEYSLAANVKSKDRKNRIDWYRKRAASGAKMSDKHHDDYAMAMHHEHGDKADKVHGEYLESRVEKKKEPEKVTEKTSEPSGKATGGDLPWARIRDAKGRESVVPNEGQYTVARGVQILEEMAKHPNIKKAIKNVVSNVRRKRMQELLSKPHKDWSEKEEKEFHALEKQHHESGDFDKVDQGKHDFSHAHEAHKNNKDANPLDIGAFVEGKSQRYKVGGHTVKDGSPHVVLHGEDGKRYEHPLHKMEKIFDVKKSILIALRSRMRLEKAWWATGGVGNTLTESPPEETDGNINPTAPKGAYGEPLLMDKDARLKFKQVNKAASTALSESEAKEQYDESFSEKRIGSASRGGDAGDAEKNGAEPLEILNDNKKTNNNGKLVLKSDESLSPKITIDRKVRKSMRTIDDLDAVLHPEKSNIWREDGSASFDLDTAAEEFRISQNPMYKSVSQALRSKPATVDEGLESMRRLLQD